MTTKPLHIAMLGLRGFPNVQGGVESHVEKLSRELVAMGCMVTVIVRARHQPADIGPEWKGIRFKRIWAPSSTRFEAIVHTFLGLLYAASLRPDILHIHAIGPALMTPLARLLGLRVIVTHHGEDYNRQKWGTLAKLALKLGGRLGMRYANARIAISTGIRNSVTQKFGIACSQISNGVDLPALTSKSVLTQEFRLTPRRYVLLVSRFVPEKRHLDLIEAFTAVALPDWKLVLVGAADKRDPYAASVLAAASNAKNIVCTGFMGGENLHEIYLHAGFFVLPSSHEGLPISILEALSYGLPVIASDIPSNREIHNEAIDYFPVGDISALTQILRKKAQIEIEPARCEHIRSSIKTEYQWGDIAQKTHTVYQTVRI